MLPLLRILFYLVLFFFLLDIFELFQTRIDFLKMLSYYGVFFLPIVMLIFECNVNRGLSKGVLKNIVPILTIIGLLYLNPIKILFNIKPWKTQSVELVINQNKKYKTEIQRKDMGALGYAKRKVTIYEVTPYFYAVLSKN